MNTNIYIEYEDESVNVIHCDATDIHEIGAHNTTAGEATLTVTSYGAWESFDNMREAIGDMSDDYVDGGVTRTTTGWEDEPVLSYMETFYGEKFATHYAIPETHTLGTEFDPVARPAHYTEGRDIEPINVILDWELDFLDGQVVKYVSRAGRKGDALEDYRKAEFYLKKKIEQLEEEE